MALTKDVQRSIPTKGISLLQSTIGSANSISIYSETHFRLVDLNCLDQLSISKKNIAKVLLIQVHNA